MNFPLKLRKYALNSLLLIASLLICLLIGELILQAFLNPVDYLEPKLIADDVIRWRIEPFSAGHDDWGYRNESVPDSVDIVTIGDSQTYGANVLKDNTWPVLLEKLLQERVYNLGLGGYGPIQYFHLLKEKAFTLNPSTVVAGFYYGNDLQDAFLMASKYEYWNHLLSEEFYQDSIWSYPDLNVGRSAFLVEIRKLLLNRSILYRLLRELLTNTIYATVKSLLGEADEITVLKNPKSGIKTAFAPPWQIQFIDQSVPAISEGLRISLQMFQEMNQLCIDKNIGFIVLLIPTKESVFTHHLLKRPELKHARTIKYIISNEAAINSQVKNHFDVHHINFIDLLPVFQAAIDSTVIYPPSIDAHPNKLGHSIIADTLGKYLGYVESYSSEQN
ncbi:hypothetical protein CEE37_00590 [candidate division LCP-89 bacterium B3_LCP]|uniref:SGNH hydrolase-type esterase domain-containing protein n=1 Tax=candidate division LCP-89 bacterium B3_LCP TaxID=2012998 RepID=A0A532V4W0_UNCL8|nr:MAG: hypothetical protein CEE37_00590 [candidate division LCP-89 bacterium B3_LCP]